MSEHSGVTGKTPHQVARADSLRKFTDACMVRGRIDLVAYLQDFWKNEISSRPRGEQGRPDQLFRRGALARCRRQ
jgi:hypothetical protein